MIFFKDMVILDFSYYFMCSVSRVRTLVSVGEGVPVEMSEEGMRAPRTVSHQMCIWNTTRSSATARTLNQNQCSSPKKSMVLWDKAGGRH